MKMKAAVCRKYGAPITVEEVELAPPKAHEVLVKTAYTGLCHSDFTAVAGNLGVPIPSVLGHESAGVVVAAGRGVTSVKKGDPVVAVWQVSCGKCKFCVAGRDHLCEKSRRHFMDGMLMDGTTRLADAKGKPLFHSTFISGFAEYMVLPEAAAVKIRKDFPLHQACFIGCCMPTGFGAAYNVAGLSPGNSVAVWGMGGIGLNIVQGARVRGAGPIIAVDIEGSKEAIAREFGATHFIDSSKEDPVPKIQEMTGGGVDYAFEAVGDPGSIVQSYWAVGIGGKLIITGVHRLDETVPINLALTPPHNRDIIGNVYGNLHIHQVIPSFIDMIMDGRYINLDKLVTKKFKLDDINDAFDAMGKRQIQGRWVCAFD